MTLLSFHNALSTVECVFIDTCKRCFYWQSVADFWQGNGSIVIAKGFKTWQMMKLLSSNRFFKNFI